MKAEQHFNLDPILELPFGGVSARRRLAESRWAAKLDGLGVCSEQDDLAVANGSGATVRADMNAQFLALGTRMSGASAPATTYHYQVWVDTTNGVVKRRNAANSGWIVEGTIDETFALARSSNTMLDVSDKGKAIDATASFTQTFDAVASLTDGWYVTYKNSSTGAITFDPNSTETIDGATTATLNPGESCVIYCNGSVLKTFGISGMRLGKHTAWVPAGAMVSRTTNGPSSGTTESTTNKVMMKTLDFDGATAEYAQFQVRMPKSWDLGTVTAYFVWRAAGGTGNVIWGLQGVAISDDDVVDAAFGTAQTVTDGVTATTDVMQSAETAAITIAGTPAVGDLVVFQVYRDAAAGGDTLNAVDASLIGVVLVYSVNAGNDA